MPSPTTQLLSRTIYAADGVTTNWNFSFSGGYISTDHIKAYIEASSGARTNVVITPDMLTGPYQLQITPAVISGNNVVIYRDTPKDIPLVDFNDEGALSEVSLDTNAKQAVFIAAEAIDIINTFSSFEAEQSAIEAANSALAASISAAAAADSADLAVDGIDNWHTLAVQLGASATLTNNTVVAGDTSAGDLVVSKGTHETAQTELLRVTNKGNLIVGGKPLGHPGDTWPNVAGTRDAITVSRDLVGLTDCHAFDDKTVIDGVTDYGGYGVFDATTTLRGSNAQGHMFSFQDRTIYEGSGSIGQRAGFYSRPEHNGTGTITTSYGAIIKNLIRTNTGTVGAQIGVLVENLTAATSNVGINIQQTAGYALYAAGGGETYLAGDTGIGSTPQPDVKLYVAQDSSAGSCAIKISKANGSALYSPSTGTLDFVGNACIGSTADPLIKLHVTADAGVTTALAITKASGYSLYSGGAAPMYHLGEAGFGTLPESVAITYKGDVSSVKGFLDTTNNGAYIGAIGANPLIVVTNGQERVRFDASGNLGVGVSTFGTGAAKVIGMANATAPTTSPAGMGQLYVEGGALKFRGSSGTVTTIAPA